MQISIACITLSRAEAFRIVLRSLHSTITNQNEVVPQNGGLSNRMSDVEQKNSLSFYFIRIY